MDQTLTPDEERLLELLADHDSLGPVAAANSLGLDKAKVVILKNGLKPKGHITTGEGGSMQLLLSTACGAWQPKAKNPSGQEANGTLCNEPVPVTYPMPGRKAKEPKSQEVSMLDGEQPKPTAKKPKATTEVPIEKQLWKTADKLRKNIDAAEYKHILNRHDAFNSNSYREIGVSYSYSDIVARNEA